MTFAQSAGRLAGMAGAALGWSPDRFWAATPAELASVVNALAGAGGGAAAAPPDAAMLAQLKEAFPDG
ncbi:MULTISPECIES: phage tail assembly chaperone [unclassified Sphingomonas]|uniref:phage tail assembly chaperone n=1 Tax=unclassified Sphingomonas TaxID=196159 RepID=UPI00226A396B